MRFMANTVLPAPTRTIRGIVPARRLLQTSLAANPREPKGWRGGRWSFNHGSDKGVFQPR